MADDKHITQVSLPEPAPGDSAAAVAASDGSRRSSRPMNQLRHPSGRIVHVANTPDLAETMKRQLSRDHGEGQFDLYIRGSKEHIEAIDAIRSHHEERRNEFRKKHGKIYEEFEAVHSELDKLSEELHSIAGQGQSVTLNANFDKFGYSARIRTREDDGEFSRSNSISQASTDEDRRRGGEAIPFFRKPTIRQYFHKGMIWRSSEHEEVAPYELFVDTLYVGIIEILAERASEDPTGQGLLRFCVTFTLSWKLWSELTQVLSWFQTNDIFHRICVVIFMACIIGYTTNIEYAFGETYTELISFYLAQRFFQVAYFIFASFIIPMIRGAMLSISVMILMGAALWIGSIHVEWPERLALIWVAIFWDLFAIGIISGIFVNSEGLRNTPLAPLAKHLQFYPALNIEHRTERTNAFVTLVFGYSVVALLFQSSAPSGINAFYGKAVLGLIIAFSFNLLYFEIDGANLYVHAIRRSRYSFLVWQTIHLPFILSYILASSALARLVEAHDSPNSDIETLAESYQEHSEEEIGDGLRWFFCAGLGVSLACMGIISLTHDHKATEGVRLSKRDRIILRFVVSIILICLPLTHSLNSLELVATTTGLILIVITVDLWGNTCPRNSFWFDRTRCKYAADCKLKRADLEALRKGEVTDIEELAKRQKGEKDGVDII